MELAVSGIFLLGLSRVRDHPIWSEPCPERRRRHRPSPARGSSQLGAQQTHRLVPRHQEGPFWPSQSGATHIEPTARRCLSSIHPFWREHLSPSSEPGNCGSSRLREMSVLLGERAFPRTRSLLSIAVCSKLHRADCTPTPTPPSSACIHCSNRSSWSIRSSTRGPASGQQLPRNRYRWDFESTPTSRR